MIIDLSDREIELITTALLDMFNNLQLRLMDQDSEEDSRNFLDTIALLQRIAEIEEKR